MVVKIEEYTSVASILLMTFNILCLKAVSKKRHIYKILLWTSRHTKPFNLFEEGRKSFTSRNCEFQNCNVTFGKSFVGYPQKYDAILFNAVSLAKKKKPANQILPRKRSERQKYVLVSTESAANHPIHSDFDRVFNLTWTYKLNSDIVWQNIVIRKIRNSQTSEVVGPRKAMNWVSQNKTLSDEVRKQLNDVRKNQIVASFLLNCNVSKINDEYMNGINEALTHKFGNLTSKLGKFKSCFMKYDLQPKGTKKVEKGVLDCSIMHNNSKKLDLCETLIESKYFFHLIFENYLAEDYVSESLLTALSNFAVPVVLGGADYTRFMPDGAYINAKGLKPEQLVEKLLKTLINIEPLENMHLWRNHYTYHAPDESPETDPICQFCAYLNNKTEMKKRSTYLNITSWFNVDDDFKFHRIQLNNTAIQIIDLYNFTFKLNSDICKKEPPLTIVGVIPSEVTHFDRRRTIRETWGQPTDDLKVVFILGESKNETIENQIIEEHKQYGDIVQGNFVDSFRNLSYKHIMALKWVTQHCQVAKYILKTDDDVFVHLHVLEKLINYHFSETDEIICHVFFGMQPIRVPFSKYYVSTSEFPFPFYLPYCSGPFVLYNSIVAPLIVAAANSEPYFFLEDVFVGVLRKKLNLSLTDISAFTGRNYPILTFSELLHLQQIQQLVLYIFDLEQVHIRYLWDLTEKLTRKIEKGKYKENENSIEKLIVRYSPGQIVKLHRRLLHTGTL